MKRLIPFAFILMLMAAAIFNGDTSSKINSGNLTRHTMLLKDQALTKPGTISQFAWQAAPTATQIEDTKHISWWWWVLGVVLVIAGGMLLYVLIKKNPRKDVR